MENGSGQRAVHVRIAEGFEIGPRGEAPDEAVVDEFVFAEATVFNSEAGYAGTGDVWAKMKDGKFERNAIGQPAGVVRPGYSKEFLEEYVKQTGERYKVTE